MICRLTDIGNTRRSGQKTCCPGEALRDWMEQIDSKGMLGRDASGAPNVAGRGKACLANLFSHTASECYTPGGVAEHAWQGSCRGRRVRSRNEATGMGVAAWAE